jgi:NADH dehydrogenase
MSPGARSNRTVPPTRPRVVIVGAGFAGVAAAREFDGSFDVTVIDRGPWFEWLPNVHELLSGVKRPADLRLPRARLLRRAGHRFVRGEAMRVLGRPGIVVMSDGRRLPFDACIVAVGGEGETRGIPGADRHAMRLRGVDESARIGRRLAALQKGPRHASVVIVGGGFEGIEALGEILRRRGGRRPRVSLVEAGSRLMPQAAPALDASVRRHCADLDVQFLLRTCVTRVTPRRVYLDDGRVLRSDLTIWTGGLRPPALLAASGLARRPGQWVPVSRALQSRRCKNVFVAGDSAQLPRPLAKQGFYALETGAHAAGNVRRLLAGRRLRDFVPSAKPLLVAFGALDTYLAAKESVFLGTMAQLDPPLGADAVRGAARRAVAAARKARLSA